MSRAFSIAMTACAAKFSEWAICPSVTYDPPRPQEACAR